VAFCRGPESERLPPEVTEMRILIVEDEAKIAEAIAAVLRSRGDAVDVVGDGNDALEWAASYQYDVIVLDLNLAGRDGLGVCSALRAHGNPAHILMLTARDDIQDRVTGLDRGADDYMTKPFAMTELLARIRALRRRQVGQPSPVLQVGELTIDPASLTVRKGGRAVTLTAREFALLEVLARHAGQVLSHDRLIEAVWGIDFTSESNLLEVYVRSLRRKLGEGMRAGCIETVRGAGYRLRANEAGGV
jgi:two-component system OmpR family response regulator